MSKIEKLKTIGMVKKTIEKDDKIEVKKRCYINSIEIDIDLFEGAVRGHWEVGVMYLHLDVEFNVVVNSTLDKIAAKNINIIVKNFIRDMRERDAGKSDKTFVYLLIGALICA